MYYIDSHVVIEVASNVTMIFLSMNKIVIDRNVGKIPTAKETNFCYSSLSREGTV